MINKKKETRAKQPTFAHGLVVVLIAHCEPVARRRDAAMHDDARHACVTVDGRRTDYFPVCVSSPLYENYHGSRGGERRRVKQMHACVGTCGVALGVFHCKEMSEIRRKWL